MKMIKIQSVVVLFVLMFSACSIAANTKTSVSLKNPEINTASAVVASSGDDFDPLCDVQVTFTLQSIRSLERTEPQLHVNKKIDAFGAPDFFVKVFINGVSYTSPVWKNNRYDYNVNWSVTADVPDDKELVNITIELWDWTFGLVKQCDVSSFYNHQVARNYGANLIYSIATGAWIGDDSVNSMMWLADNSGYGRLNGCDDGSYNQPERDCELWFKINQTDPDGDGIPYWTEVNVYGTDPAVDNTGQDFDHDGCPIEWEHKWGQQMYVDEETNTTYHWWIYNPVGYDNQSSFDPDNDGLNNVEEYRTSQWGSDPFRKDIFIELDQMAPDPAGFMVQFPEGSKEMLRTAYDSRNIVYHLDDGSMGGGESIPFTKETLDRDDLSDIYFQYFLHGDLNNWRVGVFHYALNLYDAGWAGYVWDNGYTGHLDSLQISVKYQENYTLQNPLYNLRRMTLNKQVQRNEIYAAALMHETGHTLGVFNGNTPGADNWVSASPLQADYWRYGPYKSVMNYRYIYSGMVDYSDGSRGKNDFNDWDNIDLTFFQS
jgi:hypothetical protein